MSEKEKIEILESIKRLSPEKRAYVAGIANGLSLAEGKDKLKESKETNHDDH